MSQPVALCVVRGCNRGIPRLAVVGLNVCMPCGARLQRRLSEIPELFRKLDPAPQTAGTERVPGKPVFESKSPANDDHVSLRDPRSVDGPIWIMQEWQYRIWRARAKLTIEVCDDIDGLVESMKSWLTFVSGHVFAAEFYAAMDNIWRRLKHATDPKIEKRNVISKCVGLNDVPCGAPLYAPTSGYLVECIVCGATYNGVEQIALAKKSML